MDFTIANRIVQGIVNLLPTSPFASILSELEVNPPPGLGWLNWFVPVGEILVVIAAYLAAIAGYYLYSVILRWVKAIGD